MVMDKAAEVTQLGKKPAAHGDPAIGRFMHKQLEGDGGATPSSLEFPDSVCDFLHSLLTRSAF